MSLKSISGDGLTPLAKAQAVMAAKRAAGIKIVVLDPIAKARANPRSLRLAINGKCWDCIGAGADSNPRAAIRDCAIQDCTLWPVRPYRESGDDEDSSA